MSDHRSRTVAVVMARVYIIAGIEIRAGSSKGTIEGALALGLYKTYPATKNSTVTHDSHFAWLTVMAL